MWLAKYRNQFSVLIARSFFLSLSLFVITTATGCIGFSKKDGNAEAYSGRKPALGVYYQVDTRAECPASSVSGYRGVLEVTATHVNYHGACESAVSIVPLTHLSVSALGSKDIPTENPLLAFGGGLFDRMDTAPSAVSIDRVSTRAWCTGKDGNKNYDVVVRAQGTETIPTATTALVLSMGKIVGSFDVNSANSPSTRTYIGDNFSLQNQISSGVITGSLTAEVSGKNLEIASLSCLDTFLTPPSVTRIYKTTVLRNAPLGYWRLGESGGILAGDATTNFNSGTYSNIGGLAQPGAISGDSDTAASFNGSNSYVDVGNSSLSLEYTDSFSLEAWINTSSAQNEIVLGKTEGGNAQGYYLILKGDGGGHSTLDMILQNSNSNYIAVYGNATVNDGKWHHVVGSYNGSGLASGVSLYVDGVPQIANVDSDNLSGLTIVSTGSFKIGNRIGGLAVPFNGLIDEPAVYKSALSALQAASHYNAGQGNF